MFVVTFVYFPTFFYVFVCFTMESSIHQVLEIGGRGNKLSCYLHISCHMCFRYFSHRPEIYLGSLWKTMQLTIHTSLAASRLDDDGAQAVWLKLPSPPLWVQGIPGVLAKMTLSHLGSGHLGTMGILI